MTGASNEKVDSFLGYFVEAPRALYHIVSDNSVGKVRIENLDDVSVFDYDNKIKKLEQIKYKSPCNFTDYSKDLWNTLFNWHKRINENRDNLNNDIKFVIYSWDKCEIGDLANSFLNIKINNNFSEIWNQQENYFKNKDDTNEIKKYFDELNKDKDLIKYILNAFYIEQPNISSTKDFENMLEDSYGDTFKPIDKFNIYIKGRFGIYLENPELKEKSLIEITRKQFDFYKDRYDRIQSYDLLDSINIEQQKVENLKSSLMAKQLEAVSLNDSVNTAIEDYVAWDTLCTDCLSNGYLNELDIRQVYAEAKTEWAENRNCLSIKNKEYNGAELYYECCKETIKPKYLTIQGSAKRVTRGVYNTMANNPIQSPYSIGWHCKYEEIFRNFYENNI